MLAAPSRAGSAPGLHREPKGASPAFRFAIVGGESSPPERPAIARTGRAAHTMLVFRLAMAFFGVSQMSEAILGFLRANAEQLDVDMAEALNIPLAELRDEIARLAAAGDVICCKVTRFIEGRKIEGISCRLSCDLPTPARGRKPGVKKDDDAEAPVF